jgi:hypothetical protein
MKNLTSKHLVRSMYLEIQGHRYNDGAIVEYFISGFKVCAEQKMDQFEYWRSIVQIYPNLADVFFEKLKEDAVISEQVKKFLYKMALLK